MKSVLRSFKLVPNTGLRRLTVKSFKHNQLDCTCTCYLRKPASILVASTKMLGLKLKVCSVLKTEMYVKTSRTAEITAAPHCFWVHRGKMFF